VKAAASRVKPSGTTIAVPVPGLDLSNPTIEIVGLPRPRIVTGLS
jgi:hypothetical protein